MVALLRERGADEAVVNDEDRAVGARLSGEDRAAPRGVTVATLDAMLMGSVEGGHLEAMLQLLDAGAPVDGDPATGGVPIRDACWRGRVQMARELVERGAALVFPSGGSAIGAALHGSRHCHHPEGGPSMATIDEIPREPYAEIVRLLLAAGEPVP